MEPGRASDPRGPGARESGTIARYAPGAGEQLYGRIRAAITEITGRLWGDLPPGDLATAGRVLAIVTERAHAELAGS